LLRRLPDISRLIQHDDTIDEGTFLPQRSQFLRRSHGQHIIHDHRLDVAHRRQCHDRIAQPVRAAHNKRALKQKG